jgi:hypothetical protein
LTILPFPMAGSQSPPLCIKIPQSVRQYLLAGRRDEIWWLNSFSYTVPKKSDTVTLRAYLDSLYSPNFKEAFNSGR